MSTVLRKSIGSISSNSSENRDTMSTDPMGGNSNNKNVGGLFIKMKSSFDGINDLVLSPATLDRDPTTPLGRKVSGYLKNVIIGTPKVIDFLNFRAKAVYVD